MGLPKYDDELVELVSERVLQKLADKHERAREARDALAAFISEQMLAIQSAGSPTSQPPDPAK